MRALAATLMLYAGVASAEPDCAQEPYSARPELELAEFRDDPDIRPTEASAASNPDVEQAIAVSPRPALRPCRFRKLELGRELMRERGTVCHDWTILGKAVKPVTGKFRGCGISSPVRVFNISDVALSQLALMDCQTAITLKTWIENTAKPAFADMGGGLKGMRLAGHYACKTQNNQPGARLSEHARGRAIDISAFVLKDGTILTVGESWSAEHSGEVMRELHSGACEIFGTVLGPDADQYHKGHFHFDTARRSNGSVCR